MVSICIPAFFGNVTYDEEMTAFYYLNHDTSCYAVGLPAHSKTRGVGLEHCSDAISMMPLRAPQRVLEEPTPRNCHISTTHRQSFSE